jgi:exonuclease SbcC
LEGDFVIDFTAEPLKSAGMYAITGSTGAGKSTILDAMCLALFDNAPRTHKATENIQIPDVSDKTINQKDCRNILRKGTGEGLAEVEFIALNGKRYRSTWMVRRTRNKPEGMLQNTEMRLYNMSESVEEQGTKKELLLKITELTGLTFDQFTRAVLLAQGDFATFLKAKQSDKAELLEKLTGTEIYSRISETIYIKTKEASDTVDLLQQKINDVKLITPEELDSIYQEKLTITEQSKPLKDVLLNIDKKLQWIKQHEELTKETEAAVAELKQIKQTVTEAKARYDYIDMLDVSLEIRDTYVELEEKQKQRDSLHKNLAIQEAQHKTCIEQSAAIEQELLKDKTNREQAERDFTTVKPQIEKAKELDVKIQSAETYLAEQKKEFEIQNKLKTQCEANIKKINERLSETKQAAESISAWFEEKAELKDIVQQTDLILSLLNDAQFAKKQVGITSANKTKNESVLNADKQTLKQLEEESERLNNLLPTEILNLREKLEENKPCPVCGSVHHPLKSEINRKTNINEQELEKSKKNTANAIAEINKNIEATKDAITRLEELVKGYTLQHENAVNKLEKPLQGIKNWKEWLEKEGVLQKRLSDFAKLWTQHESEQNNNRKLAESLTVKLESETENLTKITAECERKNKLWNNAGSTLNILTTERKSLLDGKKADEVESYFNDLLKQVTKKYENSNIRKTEIKNKEANISGIISRIKEEIENVSVKISTLNTAVIDWLNDNQQKITPDILKDLVAKSHIWITKEKRELSDFKDKEIRLAATFKERNLRLEKHGESAHKPTAEESKSSLQQLLTETTNMEHALKQQLTKIEVILAKYAEDKQHAESLQKDLKIKTEKCEEWKKLNYLFGSADGNKFKTIAQGYTLDILLDYANKHLEELTKRYKLEKIEGTLALQVVDNDMLGEIRTIHSLSGGESFLISLSLALGLSALSSNRMRIESLFIDEGFGSLDSDTLEMAIGALENLHTQGRKVGIISHVGELRIAAQIQVIKSGNGKSKIKIVG